MTRVLYIASSSYSGSTLLAFLLNTHPHIFTVGEMEGWHYGEQEKFRCSCGAALSDCPFFQDIAHAFATDGLRFDFRDFGTAYRLAAHPRIDRYLTAALPLVSSPTLAQLRDACVMRVPRFAARLAQQDRANRTFIRRALAYRGASVFADASKSAYRLRHLRRIRDLGLQVVYLIRDPRGVVLSNMVKRGLDAKRSTVLWIREQVVTLSVLQEFPDVMQLFYEELCDTPDETMAELYRFVGLAPQAVPSDFKSVEHHILGNWMRLRSGGAITRNTSWKDELSGRDLDAILESLRAFLSRHETHPLSAIIRHYLEQG